MDAMKKTGTAPCGGVRPSNKPADLREALLRMHDSAAARDPQRAAAMLRLHRLAVCCRGSECGRLCEHLVKAPGVAQVYCVGADGEKRELYPSLEARAFACPKVFF